MQRASAELPLTVSLQASPSAPQGLYYSLALVGILTIVVGASVRLRRPHDLATLHFFWLTVAFFGVLAFTASGRYDRIDYFFDWADLVARLMLPPLFLHFGLVFPDRPKAWVRSVAGRALVPAIYLPAASLGAGRVAVVAGFVQGPEATVLLERIEWLAYLYLAVCLLGGLALMTLALRRLRSVTAHRQLRWIIWGSAVGAVPFVTLYVLPLLFGGVPPYAAYTAVLLGCVPLSFASALVRYRLMDVEVIIKKALVVAAVVTLLAAIYSGTLRLVALVLRTDSDRSSFWALLATLIVAMVAPKLWNAIQNALDRLYYRDRYDYRRALVSFARELNSDLDLHRLSGRLVERVRETLSIDRIALFLATRVGRGRPARRRGVRRLRTGADAGGRPALGALGAAVDGPDGGGRRSGGRAAAAGGRGGVLATGRAHELRALRVERRDDCGHRARAPPAGRAAQQRGHGPARGGGGAGGDGAGERAALRSTQCQGERDRAPAGSSATAWSSR